MPDQTVDVIGECMFCKKVVRIRFNNPVQYAAYVRWVQGNGYIQDELPFLPAGKREFLMSRICEECFDKEFPEEDDSELDTGD